MAASLVNLLGFTTGAILYAMLFGMVVRSSSDRLSLLTGVLGLFWNIGAFFGYGLYMSGFVGPSPFLMAVAFSALGFLPAVVVHSVLRSRIRSSRIILYFAYLLSFIGAILHVGEALRHQASPSQLGLQILTAGFALLMMLVLLITWKSTHRGQSIWIVSLAVFAVSALHLSNHQGTDPWWLELIGHHSSVPLALAFLHQDYRFALADIFLKRAVAFVLLVSMVFGFYVTGRDSMLMLLAMWVASALIYPWIRSTASWFVDNVVLHRPDYDMLLAELARAIGGQESADAIFIEVRQLLGPALFARSVHWEMVDTGEMDPHNIVTVTAGRSAVAMIPTVEKPHYAMSIGELEGGRKLLSDDIAFIERMALITARRIDVVRTNQERLERNSREREMSRLTAEAELRALRAQIHPHFLFNALTTIGYLIQTSPERALKTLMRLSGLLRIVLRSAPEYSTLDDELKIVAAYLDIEKARFEERLSIRIDVNDELRQFRIPTLLLQPLVENAVKHGISRSIAGGEVAVRADLVPAGLRIVVQDSGSGADEGTFAAGRLQGVGLNSVRKRLQCYGPDRAGMHISSSPGSGTRIEIVMPAEPMSEPAVVEKPVRGAKAQ